MSSTDGPQAAAAIREQVQQLLGRFKFNPESTVERRVQIASFLARELQVRAADLQTPAERRQQAELDNMIQNASDKATLLQLTDQSFRARLPHRAADQLIHILDVQGIPRFFSTLDRTLLKGFQSFGSYLPGVSMPFVQEKMRQETANVVLPAEEDLLRDHLHQRREEGLRMNVNLLGEALLGEREAERRLQNYLQVLQRPEIEVISVKISTIYSQISPIARRHTVEVLCDRMELLYRAAARNAFRRADGTSVPKFVYLDMEEYRDMRLTSEVFMRSLEREGCEQVRAGIALQAYLPDSFLVQQEITDWARKRVANGSSPVTIRLVKGANMEMERVEASIRGWPLATFHNKVDTDANYLRMLDYGFEKQNLEAVHLGIASHNLFTLAYGLVLAVEHEGLERVQFEMLEGMANHQRRALFELTQNVLLYAPACEQQDFINAIGYLVRRLDENTGPENFLRHAFRIQVDSDIWRDLQAGFVAAVERKQSVPSSPRRTQDRSAEVAGNMNGPSPSPSPADRGGGHEVSPRLSVSNFRNEPDTDWSLVQNSDWGATIVERWQSRCNEHAAEVPLNVAGELRFESGESLDSVDPSRPETVVARYLPASESHADEAVRCAKDDPDGWRRLSIEERRKILFRTADEIAHSRGELMGAMLAEGGKLLTESDPEVSEAIDFCRFYSLAAEEFHRLPGLSAQGRGVVVVVTPWNFPLAIPCGGIASSLAAGNTVIFKPATDTVLIAYLLCECFWRAGVPRTALQFLPGAGGTVGHALVTHERVDSVILTGGTETALRMLAARPEMRLFAETGGKNATIVTALSDRDLAIKNVLHSAFSHSGQKCSATSLLILESEVYRDKGFRGALCDAVESLHVDSAWKLHTKLGPLIRPPSGKLERGLKELEPGETWAVMPEMHVDGNPHLVSPGVKWDVQPNSVTHTTEFFGPLLGVMEARNLHEAIDLVNATGYGLTSGLESLDDREHQLWQEGIRAGNLYINRTTTGAVVLRQPFGGMEKSVVGPGIKAGGPNYVAQFMQFETLQAESVTTENQPDLGDTGLDDFCYALRDAAERGSIESYDCERIVTTVQSYEHWMSEDFSQSHDHFRLVGEDNFRRYLPLGTVRVRVHREDSTHDIFARAIASRTAGCRTVISSPPGLNSPHVSLLDKLTDDWAGAIEFVEEPDSDLAEVLRECSHQRIRFAHSNRVPRDLRLAAAEAGTYLADEPVSAHGRVELLWYFQEQSLSHIYHRYGNLGARCEEERAGVT